MNLDELRARLEADHARLQQQIAAMREELNARIVELHRTEGALYALQQLKLGKPIDDDA